MDVNSVEGKKSLNSEVPLIYEELRRIAHRELLRRRPGDTLNTTALVHEAYLKLSDQSKIGQKDRNHFFSIAARTMRHILIDYFRVRGAQKRGDGKPNIRLESDLMATENHGDYILALDEALECLKKYDERLVCVVECRIFGGLTVKETAEALSLSSSNVDRCWKKAKIWLLRFMKEE